MRWVVKGEVAEGAISGDTERRVLDVQVFKHFSKPGETRRKLLSHPKLKGKNTDQKLSVMSISPAEKLLTSLSPANATFAGKNLLKDAMAAAARSRYFVSPVSRHA